MAKTYNVRTPAELRRAYERIAKGIAGPFKSTRRMFMMLGVQIDRDTQLTFKGQGAYTGRQKWVSFNKGRGVGFMGSTTRTKKGTWKIRYGTDQSGVGSQGKFRPGARRYSMSSKLLQASTQFKQSFRILKVGNMNMLYGTRHRLAEEIMSNPARPAIQYTRVDRDRYAKTIIGWWSKGIKF